MARGGYESIGNRHFDAETVLIPLLFGFLFGFAVVKSSVYFPSVVFGQLAWRKFLLIKFYLASLAASLIAGAIISLSGSDGRRRFEASRITYSNGWLSVLMGAALSGLGMALTGTEPAGAFTQVGSGVWSGWWVILGGVLAVVTYGFLYRDVFRGIDEAGRRGKSSLDEALGAEYWQIALTLGALIIFICWLIEKKCGHPWSSETPVAADTSLFPSLKSGAWNVYLCGGFVGLLQIPLRTSLFVLLDSTSAYIGMFAVPFKVFADNFKCTIPDWFRYHGNSARLWAVFFFFAASLGGLAAASLGKTMEAEKGFGVKWCLMGGFCLVLGALIAGACPTGLAVSGCSDLNLSAMAGTTLMFLCGIALSQLLKSQNVHPESSRSMVTGALSAFMATTD